MKHLLHDTNSLDNATKNELRLRLERHVIELRKSFDLVLLEKFQLAE